MNIGLNEIVKCNLLTNVLFFQSDKREFEYVPKDYATNEKTSAWTGMGDLVLQGLSGLFLLGAIIYGIYTNIEQYIIV